MGWRLIGIPSRWQETLITWMAAFLGALIVIPPIAHVFVGLTEFHRAFHGILDFRLWLLLARTVILSLSVMLVALTLGVPLGLLFARYLFPLRHVLLLLHVSVVFLPPLLPAIGWFNLLLLVGGSHANLLFNDLGVVLVLATCFTPIVTAFSVMGFRTIDPSLDEAARLVANPIRTTLFVRLPIAAPVILLGALLVFSFSFSELAVPTFFHVEVYSSVVFSRLAGLDFQPGEAVFFMMPMVLVAFGLFFLERRFAGRRVLAVFSCAPRNAHAQQEQSGYPIAIAILSAFVSLLPIGSLGVQAAKIDDVHDVVRWAGESITNGILTSIFAALMMTFLAVILAKALVYKQTVGVWSDFFATLAFVLPSAVLGVGFIAVWNRPESDWLYSSFIILSMGLIARYSALTTRAFALLVARVATSQDEAARGVGADYFRRMWLLIVMMKHEIFAIFTLAFLISMRDIETSILFYPPGKEPLTVRIFTLEANGPPAVVAALSCVHVIVVYVFFVAGAFLLKRSRFRDV